MFNPEFAAAQAKLLKYLTDPLATIASLHGHVVNGEVIRPVRIGADIPTFQKFFGEDGRETTIVNPALPEEERLYYQQQLDAVQGTTQT